MKKLTLIVAIIIGLYTGCDNNITGSGNDASRGFLAKDPDVLAQIESNPPSGTSYHDGSSSQAAQGDDDLKDGYSVWNTNGYTFGISVYESTIIGFAERDSVKISNPVDTKYRRTNSIWITVTSTTTVFADSVRTGSSGSCQAEADEEITAGSDSGDLGRSTTSLE